MKFRKKPVVIEAKQWTGKNGDELMDWLDDFKFDRAINRHTGEIEVDSWEGWVKGKVGYWLIQGIKGEFYLCAPHIFEATYDKVEE